jgi:hypothetical protein
MKNKKNIEPFKYSNRYNDEYTFTLIDDYILWEGPFNYCRGSYENDFSEAYETYLYELKDKETKLGLEDFIKEVYKGTFDEYTKLIKPTDKIHMIDPSGGPYISVGTYSEHIHPEVKGKKVVEIIKNYNNSYKLILE